MALFRPTTRLTAPLLALALMLGGALQLAERPALAALSPLPQNTTPIVFDSPTPNRGSPYPSTITVPATVGSITNVTVTIEGFTHNFPDAVDLLLVGPGGQRALLMADAGGGIGNEITAPIGLTFDDAGATLPDSARLTSGTYKPANYSGGDNFPDPGPGVLPANVNTALSIFNGTSPSGTWSLYAVEDSNGTTGQIAGGWSLSISTVELEARIANLPATVNAGTILSYDVQVENFGTEPTAATTVTIGIPAGTSFDSVGALPAGWSCPPERRGPTSFVCTIGTFASGARATIPVRLLVDKARLTNTSLTASASINTLTNESQTANNSASATTRVTTLADLTVSSVTAPDTADAGSIMELVVAAANNGPSNAANARVTIVPPASTTFVSMASPAGWACAPPAVGATGSSACSIGVFEAAGTVSFTMRVRLSPALAKDLAITSEASIASDTPEAGDNNEAQDTTTVTTRADLALAVTAAPDPVSSAANLTYTFLVSNGGPSNAATATLTTEVKLGTTFVGLDAPGWTCAKPPVDEIGPVSCTKPSLAVTTETIKLTVRVLSGTSPGTLLTLDGEVGSATQDPAGANNVVRVETPVTVQADLAVTVGNVGAVVGSGAPLSYSIAVNNSGPEPAEAVTVTARIPAGSTFVSITPPAGSSWSCTSSAVATTGAVTCTNPSLDVGTERLTLAVQLGNVPNGTQLAFTAAVTSAGTAKDTNQANNSFTLTSTVSSIADLGVQVSGPSAPARPSSTVSYTISAQNSGPMSAHTAVLTSATPQHTTFVSLKAPAGWSCTTPAAGGTGAIGCTSQSFGVQTATFELALRMNPVTENVAFNLSASLSSSSDDHNEANNSDAFRTSLVYRFQSYLPVIAR